MKIQKIKKGNHFVTFLSRRFRYFLFPNQKVFSIHTIFTDKSKYFIVGEDQLDWNKLWGIDFESLFSTRNNTAMIGWRYVPKENVFEISPYVHEDKNTYHSIIKPFRVKVGEITNISITVFKHKWIFRFTSPTQEDLEYEYLLKKPRIFKWASEINLYFGGNKKAPHDVEVHKTKTVVERFLYMFGYRILN